MKAVKVNISEITKDDLDESSEINIFRKRVSENRSNHPRGHINSEPIKTLADYFKHVSCIASSQTWFRGESKEYENLTPSLYRGINDIEIQEYLEIERNIFYEFQRKSKAFGANIDESNKWSTYFLIQHYGGPTRLIDWTQNAAIALFFALDSSRESNENPIVLILQPNVLSDHALSELGIKHDSKGLVFYPGEGPTERWLSNLVHRSESKKNKIPTTPIALLPSYTDQRIFSQNSCFTLFGSAKYGLEKDGKPLTCLCCTQKIVSKIVIDGKKKNSLRNELKTIGVTRSKVFPDLEGLCRELVEEIMDEHKSSILLTS